MGEKRKNGGKNGRYFRVFHGLLTPRHTRDMGPALRVFLWCLMRTYREVRRGRGWVGLVCGGAPIRPGTIAEELGMKRTTVLEHLKILHKRRPEPYIRTNRVSGGITITLLRSKKWRLFDGEPSVDGGPSKSVGGSSVIDGGPSVFDGGPSVGSRNPKAGQRIAGTERKKRKGKEKKAVDAPTRYESEVLQALQEIPKFRRDETKNLEQIRNLGTDYPQTDIRKVAHELKRKVSEGAYSFVNGPNALRNWVRIAYEMGKSEKGAGFDLQKELDDLQKEHEAGRLEREQYNHERAAAHARKLRENLTKAAGVTK